MIMCNGSHSNRLGVTKHCEIREKQVMLSQKVPPKIIKFAGSVVVYVYCTMFVTMVVNPQNKPPPIRLSHWAND